MMKRFLEGQEGSALVLVALALSVLLGATGLVIDGGTVYVQKSRLQKAANAAVLSGAQELTESEAKVNEVVRTVLRRHEEEGQLTSSRIELGRRVSVSLHRDVPLGFSRLFGRETAPVEVTAAAEIRTMGEAAGAAPLGIDEAIPLEFGRQYRLKVDQTEVSSGNFGILALGGSGAATYEDNLKYGYKQVLKVGDIIDTQTGNIAGKTQSGVNERINRCPYPDGDYSHRDCSRIILIPVYQPYQPSSNQLKYVKITGFAYFYIAKPMNAKDTYIDGIFIERTGTGTARPEAVFKGAYAIRLTE
ncbi:MULTISPECIES: Tad domain-containing protein [Paenibacillus]|uniref:Tad domain-containing protein n=1 Tax=Paenibacillus TaxID=44249 RepID=UPI0022B8F4EA|nr:Tad domain-containing protein [Paenibacillus caseinilyticus]MCZ8521588.1 Tad domain-containing protein [Paenibacillus caseinilyticus]